MKNKSIISLNIVFASICLVFAISTYVFVYSKTNTLTNKAILSNKEIMRDSELRLEASNISSSHNLLSKYIDTILQSFVTEESVIDPIQMIEAIGPQMGVTLTIVQVEIVPEKGSDQRYLNMKITAQGPWMSIFNTIRALENISYISFVDKLNVETINTGTAKIWTLSTEIHIAMNK